MLRRHYFVAPDPGAAPELKWKVDRDAEALVCCGSREIALAFAMARARADVDVGLRAQVHERVGDDITTVWVHGADTPAYGAPAYRQAAAG